MRVSENTLSYVRKVIGDICYQKLETEFSYVESRSTLDLTREEQEILFVGLFGGAHTDVCPEALTIALSLSEKYPDSRKTFIKIFKEKFYASRKVNTYLAELEPTIPDLFHISLLNLTRKTAHRDLRIDSLSICKAIVKKNSEKYLELSDTLKKLLQEEVSLPWQLESKILYVLQRFREEGYEAEVLMVYIFSRISHKFTKKIQESAKRLLCNPNVETLVTTISRLIERSESTGICLLALSALYEQAALKENIGNELAVSVAKLLLEPQYVTLAESALVGMGRIIQTKALYSFLTENGEYFMKAIFQLTTGYLQRINQVRSNTSFFGFSDWI